MRGISLAAGTGFARPWRHLPAVAILLAAAAATPVVASPALDPGLWAGMVAATVTVEAGAVRGTGVTISTDGLVLTAAHVAGFLGQSCWVRLADGRGCRATVIDIDLTADAAVLRILGAADLPTAPVRSGPVTAGTPVTTIAFRDGAAVALTGLVVARPSGLLALPGGVVTDLSLISGDSGGPLFDGAGRLVALTVMSGRGAGRTYTLHCRTARHAAAR